MPEAVAITVGAERAIVHLKSWVPEPVLPSLVPASLGGDFRVLRVGPGEWLAVSGLLRGDVLRERLDHYLRGDSVAVLDWSCALKVLRVEGPVARELLVRGCGLDLHPEQFPVGRCTRTRFAQLPVLIHCTETKPGFDLYVGRSYFAWLKTWVEDAAVAFDAATG